MVPATGSQYRARSMTHPQPGRNSLRPTLPTLIVVTVAAMAALTLGPLLVPQRPVAEALPTASAVGASSAAPSAAAASTSGPAAVLGPPASIAIPEIRPSGIVPRTLESPSASIATRAALQKRLDGIRAKYAIPGISVAILFPDGGSWVGTSGVADLLSGAPVTPDTAFAIASVTKTFTSALILGLAEDGRIDLDTSVRTYLPDLRIDAKVTVRQLLDHTSGLRDYFFHPLIDPVLLEHPTRYWSEPEALKYAGKPYFKPGRGWHYSNTNYLVLGMLAEEVGGAPFAEQLRARFLDPLGLSDTYYQPTEPPRGPTAHGYRFASTSVEAKAVDLSDGTPMIPFTSVVTAAAGAGGLASSASDLARWARALYAGRALTPTSVQEMVDDVARTERYRPSVPYGLGVQMVEVGGRLTMGHSGRLLGFRSVLRWLPEEAVAIAVLTNQSRTDPGIIARALLKIALKPSADCVCADRR